MPQRSTATAASEPTGCLHQSRTLATLRDTLLPKLLNGELSVAVHQTNPEHPCP